MLRVLGGARRRVGAAPSRGACSAPLLRRRQIGQSAVARHRNSVVGSTSSTRLVGVEADGVEKVRRDHHALRVRRDLLLPRVGLRHRHAQEIGVGDDARLQARLRDGDLLVELGADAARDLLQRARLEVLQVQRPHRLRHLPPRLP